MDTSLQQFLEENNLTQAEAARQLQITPFSLNRIMRGVNPYTTAFLGKLYYSWHYQKGFSGVLDLMNSIASHIEKQGGAS